MKGRTLRKTEIVCAKAGNRVIVKQNLTPKNETMDIEKQSPKELYSKVVNLLMVNKKIK